MTRQSVQRLKAAFNHFANGGDLWYYGNTDRKWYKQQAFISQSENSKIHNIIEDEHFESRKADALGQAVEIYNYNTCAWEIMDNPSFGGITYRPKPTPSAREVLITKVCDQIARDVELEDFTSIEQLLEGIHGYDLIAYLPEEETNEKKT